jgi:hypothetical protein
VSKLVTRAARRKTNVTVTVNGKPWQFVSGLADSGPRDRDFTVSQTTDGKTAITFGDGVHGAPPPAGSEITVRYNGGGGTGGNRVTVTIERNVSGHTLDQALWVAIRNRTHAISFEIYKKFYNRRPRSASRKSRY